MFKPIYYEEILIPAIEREPDIFDYKITELKKYRPRNTDKIDERKNLLINAQNFYDGRKMIIQAFKNKIFPFYSGNYYHDLGEEKTSKILWP